MAFTYAAPIAPSLYGIARIGYCDQKVSLAGSPGEVNTSLFCVSSHAGKSDVLLERRKLKSADTRIAENTQMKSSVEIEIPVSCYQVIELAAFVVLCVCACAYFFYFFFIFRLTEIGKVKEES